jgi:hypothetical protein
MFMDVPREDRSYHLEWEAEMLDLAPEKTKSIGQGLLLRPHAHDFTETILTLAGRRLFISGSFVALIGISQPLHTTNSLEISASYHSFHTFALLYTTSV